MKRFSRFSFGRLLRNDRLMLICSLLLAVLMWYFVISGPANITTRTITCTLNTANVRNGSLQVIEEQTITVDVVVEGAWSDILDLTAEDIRVQLNTTDIRAAGKSRINVVAGRNSQKSGYNILSTSPSVVSLFCDEWVEERAFSVEEGEVIAVADGVDKLGENQSVNPPEVMLPGGVLFVQGPRTEVDNITRLVAVVDDEMQLSEKHVFTGDIVAQKVEIGADGKEVVDTVDIVYSQFSQYDKDLAAGGTKIVVSSLDVLVSLSERQQLSFTYDVVNKPEGVDLSTFVQMSPATVDIMGEQELVRECIQTLATLTSLDFERLSVADQELVQTVVFPAGITVLGGGDNVTKNENGETLLAVTRTINWSGYSDKRITWQINTDAGRGGITFENVPVGHVAVPQEAIEVRVVGEAQAVRRLTAADLSATITLAENNLGTYVIRPVTDNPDVWVYYTSEDKDDYYVDVKLVPATAQASEDGTI